MCHLLSLQTLEKFREKAPNPVPYTQHWGQGWSINIFEFWKKKNNKIIIVAITSPHQGLPKCSHIHSHSTLPITVR